jgi:hypothetical protein
VRSELVHVRTRAACWPRHRPGGLVPYRALQVLGLVGFATGMEITTVGHAGQPFFSRARLQPDRVQQVVMPNGVASATGSQFACQDQATASMRRLSGPGPFDRREPGAVRADFLVELRGCSIGD